MGLNLAQDKIGPPSSNTSCNGAKASKPTCTITNEVFLTSVSTTFHEHRNMWFYNVLYYLVLHYWWVAKNKVRNGIRYPRIKSFSSDITFLSMNENKPFMPIANFLRFRFNAFLFHINMYLCNT